MNNKYNFETMKLLYSEQKKCLDEFLRTNRNLETKSTVVIGFSGVILSIFLSIEPTNSLALSFMGISIMLAFIVLPNKFQPIPGVPDIEDIRERSKLDKKEEIWGLLEEYTKDIKYAMKVNSFKAIFLELSYAFSILGIILFLKIYLMAIIGILFFLSIVSLESHKISSKIYSYLKNKKGDDKN